MLRVRKQSGWSYLIWRWDLRVKGPRKGKGWGCVKRACVRIRRQ